MPRVIGIVGSPRAGGNTEQFMKIVLDIIAGNGIDTELIHLKDKQIEPCTHCRVCRVSEKAICPINDDFMPIFKKMVEADGIVIGSPVYFGSAYSKLKALLERAGLCGEGRESVDSAVVHEWPYRNPKIFERKIGGAIVTTRRTGANFTLAELVLWFLINNFVVAGSDYWTVAIGGTMKNQAEGLSKDIAEKDIEAVETVKVFADNVAWLIKKTRSA